MRDGGIQARVQLYQRKIATAKQAPIARPTCPGQTAQFYEKGSSHEGHARHADDPINVALTVFGVSMAAMSPMMFDSGGGTEAAVGDILESLDFPRRRLSLCRVLALALSGCDGPAPRSSRPPSITWMIILAVVLFAFFRAGSRKVCSGFRKRSCSNKELERDDDSTKSRPALVYCPHRNVLECSSTPGGTQGETTA